MRRTTRAVTALALTTPLFLFSPVEAAPAGRSVAPAAPANGGADEPTGGLDDTRTPATARFSARVSNRVAGRPVAAAQEFLANRRGTLHVAPEQLAAPRTQTEEGRTTVRFGQSYHGVPVLGSQYVVRMTGAAGAQRVTGTSGIWFSDLDVDTSRGISWRLAKRLALRQTRDRHWARTPRVSDGGMRIVPVGGGTYTREVVLRGRSLIGGRPLALHVFIRVRDGRIALSYDSLAHATPVDTTGGTVRGGTVPLHATRNDAGRYELRDTTHTGEIRTYDAHGRDLMLFLGDELPPRMGVTSSATVPFPTNANGANEAHWAAGRVYDWYAALGRDGLDGAGSPIVSVVGVSDGGTPFPNAFWNGSMMVYGIGGDGYRPFASSLDVVAHEITHGVTEHTAGLMYLGQSGAINEAVSDYLGNAIQNDVLGIAPSSPLDGLLGEDLCLKGTQEDCAIRDLDESMTTAEFLGIPFDNIGVHENSPIISGSWWQIRHGIGAAKADALVYRTLTEYLTPWSQFTDARDATIAAAQDSGLSPAEIAEVRQAFTDHGVVPDWESSVAGVDYRSVHEWRESSPLDAVSAGGSTWVTSQALANDAEASEVIAGDVAGGGERTLASPAAGEWYQSPVTDGKSVLWAKGRADGRTVLQRYDLSTGATTDLDAAPLPFVVGLMVAGDDQAWVDLNQYDTTIRYVHGDQEAVSVVAPRGQELADLALTEGRLVYLTSTPNLKKWYLRSVDTRTGRASLLRTFKSRKRQFIFGPVVNSTTIALAVDKSTRNPNAALVTTALDGTGLRTRIAESAANAPKMPQLTMSETALSWIESSFGPDVLSRVRQLPLSGTSPVAVTCSRGLHAYADAADDSALVWFDFSRGRFEVASRDTPVGVC